MTLTRPDWKAVLAVGLALGLLLSLVSDAEGRRRSRRDRKKRPTVVRLQRIAPEVATIPLGQDLEQVVNWARIRLEGRYLPRMKNALDMHERAAIQMEFDRAVQAAHRFFKQGPWASMLPNQRGQCPRNYWQEIQKN